VRILRDAFGPDMPRRDLLVSPEHGFPIDGRLFPAMHLINGATILQDRAIAKGTYFHIELEQHDIVLSEGLPAETYLDCYNRYVFDGQPGFKELYPDFTKGRDHSHRFCYPLTREGEALTAARATLLARAETLGYHLTVDRAIHLLTGDGRVIEADSVR